MRVFACVLATKMTAMAEHPTQFHTNRNDEKTYKKHYKPLPLNRIIMGFMSLENFPHAIRTKGRQKFSTLNMGANFERIE